MPIGRIERQVGWASQWAELPVKGHAKLRLGWTLLIACKRRGPRESGPQTMSGSRRGWVWESRLSNLDLTTRWGPPTSLSADSVCSPAKSDVITCFIMAPLGKSWSLARCCLFHGVFIMLEHLQSGDAMLTVHVHDLQVMSRGSDRRQSLVWYIVRCAHRIGGTHHIAVCCGSQCSRRSHCRWKEVGYTWTVIACILMGL